MRLFTPLLILLFASFLMIPSGMYGQDLIDFTAKEVKLKTSTGKLYGTLTLPAVKGKVPAILIVAGSGPTDRDGNTTILPGKNNSLKMLAEGLSQKGYAVLRFDKRGVGASKKAGHEESVMRFEHYVADATAWLRWLRKQKFSDKVIIAGHSEGALVSMLAVQEAGADAFVSIAGPGQNAADLLGMQLSGLPQALRKEAREILGKIKAGETVEEVRPQLQSVFRPSVQPYLHSWFAYTPTEEIKKLNMPMLIVQGTTDLQVLETEMTLLAEASPDAKSLLVEGMNHVLKPAPMNPGANSATYMNPNLKLSPDLLKGLTKFLAEHLK